MWTLQRGARLSVSAPKNDFELALDSPGYLLIAGGVGVTPILGMALRLAARGARFRVLYAARSRADLALADELAAAAGDRLEVFVSEEGRRIDPAAAVAGLAADGELYLCGPNRMIEDFRRAWGASGRRAGGLRVESFGTSGARTSEPFRLSVAGLGLDLIVPSNRSMLETLEAAGVEMVSNCRRGECGACSVDVVEVAGELDHRDVFLSDHQRREGRKMCPCVSRAAGRVEIDIGWRAA